MWAPSHRPPKFLREIARTSIADLEREFDEAAGCSRTEVFPGVELQGAADSSAAGSVTPRRRAHSRDAAVARPALSRGHGASARSPMGGDPEPRHHRSLGWAFLIRGCNNQLLGTGRLQMFLLRAHGRMSSGAARTGHDPLGGDATGAALHSKPLVDTDHHPRGVGAIALRGLANLARMARVRVRYLVAAGSGCDRFPGNWSHRARLLRHLLCGPPLAT